MAAAFRSHSLITSYELEFDYQAARVNIDPNGRFLNPDEEGTVTLFETLFQRVLFPKDRFMVNSQKRAAPHSQRKCDIVIRSLDHNRRPLIFCFAEANRETRTGAFDLRTLEDQATRYCEEYCAHTKEGIVYACTILGTSIRCWSYKPGEELIPFWTGDGARAYLDIGKDENVAEIMRALNDMKSIPSSSPGSGWDLSNVGVHSGSSMVAVGCCPHNGRNIEV